MLFRSKYLLEKQGVHISFPYTFKLFLIGLFYGFITPAKVGSTVQIFHLKEKLNIPGSKCSAGVILDKVSDILIIFSLSIIGILILVKGGYSSPLFWIIPSIFIILSLLFYIFMRKKTGRKLLSLIYGFIVPEKVRKKIGFDIDKFYDTLPQLQDLAVPFLVGIAIWSLSYFQAYVLIGMGLNLQIHPLYLILIPPLGTVVGLIPISVGGLGNRDATLVYILSLLGVSAEEAISLSLLGYTIGGIIPAILGSFFTLQKGLKSD